MGSVLYFALSYQYMCTYAHLQNLGHKWYHSTTDLAFNHLTVDVVRHYKLNLSSNTW